MFIEKIRGWKLGQIWSYWKVDIKYQEILIRKCEENSWCAI